jgi:Na+/melibiose symporter-like transporter
MDKNWYHNKESNTKLTAFDKFSYGIGNLGFGVIMQCISSFLMFYATVILAIPGRYVGFILSVSVLWDALTDPIVGYISDVTTFRKYGRRHFYILTGSFSVAILNYWLWNIDPSHNQLIKVSLLLLMVFLVKTSMTIYGTPYTALGAELSLDYDTRTSIQGYRIFFFLLGLAFPTVIGVPVFFRTSELFPVGQFNPNGYIHMGISISIMMVITGLMCYFVTKKYIPHLPRARKDEEVFRFKEIFTLFLQSLNNKHFSKIFWGYLFVNISSALIGSLGLHVFTYTFVLNTKQIAMVMGVFFIMTLISQPFWMKYSIKYDKQPSMQRSILISLVGCCLLTIMVFVREFVIQNYFVLLPSLAIIGFGAGGLFLFPPAMVGDVIDVEEVETGRRSEGIYFGMMTFGYKASQSIALFLVGVSLDVIGFNSNATYQSHSTSIMIGLLLTLGSVIVLASAYFAYKRYSLTKDVIHGLRGRSKEETINLL